MLVSSVSREMQVKATGTDGSVPTRTAGIIKTKEIQGSARMVVPVGVQTGAATLKSSLVSLQTVKPKLPIWPPQSHS